MNKNAVQASRRRRIVAGWAAAACGIVTLGTNPTVAVGAKPHRDRDPRAASIQAISSEHPSASDRSPRRLAATSLQAADTAGLWDGYRPGNEPRRPLARPAVGASSCGCDHSRGKLRNPLFCVLDGVAGGIEHVIGLDQRREVGHGASCDDGCDAATLHELPQLDVHAVPMVQPIVPGPAPDKPADVEANHESVPEAPQPTRKPAEPQRRDFPAPVLPDSKIDPFADEAAWTPGRNPAIARSAYFE